MFETVVVGDGGQRRSVGGQRDRGVSWTILFVAADDFGGDMLGIGGAAAVADQENLVAGTERVDDDISDGARGRQQRPIAVRALKGGERLL